MVIPVRCPGQGFTEGASVFAHEHYRRTLGHETVSRLGTVGHFCTQRTQRVRSS
jgi:hypothetical protein